MITEDFKLKLTAILSADIVVYPFYLGGIYVHDWKVTHSL